MSRLLFLFFISVGFSFNVSTADATDFKDCTKLKAACFDSQHSPEKAFVMRAPVAKRGPASKHVKKVAVLVHGLTDSPYSLKDISLFLNKNGYTVYGVLLPGHGHDPKDLLTVRNTDWLREVWSTLKFALAETHTQKALLVGTSLGGVLVTEIAEQPQWRDRISGLILQVPAYQIQNKLAQVGCDAGVAEYIQKWAERGPASTPVEYDDMATHSVCELVTLADHVRDNIKNVNVPVHVTLTEGDEDLNNEKILKVISKMQSQVKEVFYLRKSYADLEIPGIQFMQVVGTNVEHSAVNYKSDSFRHKSNPAYSQMIDDIKNFMRKNNI